MLCTPGLSRLSSDSCEKMSRAWLINSRGIAKKVRNATQSAAYQVKDYGAKRECPNCHYLINNTDDSAEWPGLPGGVKFDPSDAELLDHLAAKCGVENSKPHLFIDEFIPTLDTDQGICYTHPENLPGITKDGNGVHFFHKTSNAYATGQRKRRKIQRHYSFAEDVRWHKTGKTKAVMENGVQKGCKKIMVLYKTAKKGTKPDKTNWVMHQYHLGTEHEKEGEYVVSKVLYQQRKQFEKNDNNIEIESSEVKKIETSPRTPKADPPPPPRPRKSEHSKGKGVFQPILQEEDFASELYRAGPSSFSFEANTDCTYRAGPSSFSFEGNTDCTPWLAGESQAIENCDVNSLEYNDLLCEEIFDSRTLGNDLKLDQIDENQNKGTEQSNVSCGIADLDNIDLDTPPDFQLADLQFGSQDSIFSWLDKI